MNLYEKIIELCNYDNITISALERKLELGNGTIKKWSKTIPSGDRLTKVADNFSISLDYLMGRTNNKMALNEIIVQSTITSDYDIFIAYLRTIYDQVERMSDNKYRLTKDTEVKILPYKLLIETEKLTQELISTFIRYYPANIDSKEEEMNEEKNV